MYYLFTDNGIKGHTKKGGKGIISSAGAIINEQGELIKEYCEIEKDVTNNYGELKAIKLGLLNCIDLNIKDINIYSDSELSVKWINGEYNCNNVNCKPELFEIKELLKQFNSYSVKWISRDFNTYADWLTADALQKYRKTPKNIGSKESCFKQMVKFVKSLNDVPVKTGLKDIDLFNPKFVRVEREDSTHAVFDYSNSNYYPRDFERWDGIRLNDYLQNIQKEKGFFSYHISLASSDNKRALLCFESDEGNEGKKLIVKFTKVLQDLGFKVVMKSSGNRSLHLIVPVICNDAEDYNRMFNSLLSLLDSKEKNMIDLHLNNFNGQVRGFESKHLWTHNNSKILMGVLDNLKLDVCADNTTLINAKFGLSHKNTDGNVGNPRSNTKKYLISELDKDKRDVLINIARRLKEGERSVCVTYLASKLEDTKENRDFLKQFTESIKNKKDFDVGTELTRINSCLCKGYSKRMVEKSEHGNEIVGTLFGNNKKQDTITKGTKTPWEVYEDRLNKISDKKVKARKLNELNSAKKFLQERGLLEFIPDAKNGVLMYKNMELMEKTFGLHITKDDYRVESTGFNEKDMIKSKYSSEGLERLGNELKENIKINTSEENISDIKFDVPKQREKLRDYGKFALLNRGGKQFNYMYYDIETNYKQEPVLVGAYNMLMKRIVLARVKEDCGEDAKIEKSYVNGWEIIRCDVANAWETCFLADAETYLCCVANSLLRQGDSTPEIISDMIPNVDINYDWFKKIYNNKARSIWIAHNSKFDVNKMNLTVKKGLRHIKNDGGVASEYLTINTFGNKKQYFSYKYRLGNRTAGVYFKGVTKKYGLQEKPELELKPRQKESDNYILSVDSLGIAKALEKKRASLDALGEEYNLDFKKTESKYKFTGNEIWSDKKDDLAEVEYLINDLFLTDAVFSELCKELDVILDLLDDIGCDRKRAEKHVGVVPYIARIYSTASISKMFYQFVYSEDYDDWTQKRSHAKFYDSINDVFSEVYAGGRVEIFKHGLTRGKEIVYSDFASLYPHTSYLSNAESLLKDVFKQELEFTSDVELIELKFWEMIEQLKTKIENKKCIQKSDFGNSAVLNISISDNLRLSRKAVFKNGFKKIAEKGGRRCDLICNAESKVNVHNYDLTYAILEKILVNGLSIEDVKENINFNKGLMVIPSYSTKKDDDFYTKLYGKRKEIKSKISDLKGKDDKTTKHLTNQAQFMKILMNAGYGLSAEFVNDRKGQFYNPVLASSITSMARLLNNLAEISCKHYGYNLYYGDTDSAFMDKGAFKDVSGIFKEICALENEHDNDEYVTDMIVLGSKEYGYKTNKGKIENTLHGLSYKSRRFKDGLRVLFTDLLEDKNKDDAVDNAVKEIGLLDHHNFSHVRAKRTSLYSNMADIVNKKNEVLGEYSNPETLGDNVFRCYKYGDNGIFITDCERVTKGTFGSMFRLKEPRIYFFSVKYGFNEDMLSEVLNNIEGIPDEKRQDILIRIKEKDAEKNTLYGFLDKGTDNVKRQILKDGWTKPYSCEINEDIDIEFNEKELKVDGCEYTGYTELPKFNFSSKMQSDLTTYYSKAITSMAKSLTYWYTKKTNPDYADAVFDKRNKDLLIPQKKNEIIVPLRMVEVPESMAQIKLKLEELGKTKILDTYFKKNETGGYYGIKKKYDNDDVKEILLGVLKPRNTIITEYFNEKKYWFEIVSHKGNKNNAVLRLNIVVGNPPKLKYYLWINPTPYFNVDLWETTYTKLMFSSGAVKNVVNKVFDIAFNNEKTNTYNSIISGFSRGSSYSLQDLKVNNRYLLDIVYSVACSFIVKNSVKHSSVRVGRLDMSYNIHKEVSKEKQDLVVAFMGTQFKKEVNGFIEKETNGNFKDKAKMSSEIYSAGGGHFFGLVNKKTKISQVIYNKSEQLDHKLIKSSRKKGYNAYMLEQIRQNKDKHKDIWRLEVQAYGFNAIYKAVNSHEKIMKKLERLLRLTIKIVNKMDMGEFKLLINFTDENIEFNYWFNRLKNEKVKPPLLINT